MANQESGSSISFTILSEYFCTTGPGVFNTTIASPVTIQRFIAPNPLWLRRDTNGNVQQNSWQHNTFLWMRMDLDVSTLQVLAATLMKVDTDWCSDANATLPSYQNVYDMASSDPTRRPPAVIWNMSFAVGGLSSYPPGQRLGLDVTDQSFLVAHILNSTFASPTNVTQQACAAAPAPGVMRTLRVQLTVDFSYYTPAVAGRRRRRNVAASSTPTRGELAPVNIYPEEQSVPATDRDTTLSSTPSPSPPPSSGEAKPLVASGAHSSALPAFATSVAFAVAGLVALLT